MPSFENLARRTWLHASRTLHENPDTLKAARALAQDRSLEEMAGELTRHETPQRN